MDKVAFIKFVAAQGTVFSVTGVEYRIISVDASLITGIRLSTKKPFEIRTESLYRAYRDFVSQKELLTTKALKPYVDRVQSPSLAILKVVFEKNETESS